MPRKVAIAAAALLAAAAIMAGYTLLKPPEQVVLYFQPKLGARYKYSFVAQVEMLGVKQTTKGSLELEVVSSSSGASTLRLRLLSKAGAREVLLRVDREGRVLEVLEGEGELARILESAAGIGEEVRVYGRRLVEGDSWSSPFEAVIAAAPGFNMSASGIVEVRVAGVYSVSTPVGRLRCVRIEVYGRNLTMEFISPFEKGGGSFSLKSVAYYDLQTGVLVSSETTASYTFIAGGGVAKAKYTQATRLKAVEGVW
ncbi:MAG: hypothetical protein DRN96_01740 [Thermoproteota archaeon]|nr:MAG: hypothetical protein DRN96_01740 [Candidatus Korarchaeota archaeon]RLG54172.1 MAG: hypothetical protein DRN99_05555 [Candidatus Korarchaeota archaeon]